jgi:mitogen-activated protein kinase organizer 1
MYSLVGDSYMGHQVDSYRIDCAFSSDGAFLLSGSEDGKMYFWDIIDGQVDSFYTHGKAVRTFAVHPEVDMIVTGCIDGSAKVWTTIS